MLRILLAIFLLIPLPVLADHVPTQEPYGYEENIVTPTDADPYLEIKILSSDGWEDSPPNKYTIFFDMTTGVDASSYCVSTDFGHTDNTWNTYNFTLASLRTYFELPVGTFYYRVRSDNDTDNSYSTISAERSIALPDQTPFNETQTDWSAPTTTCVDTSTTTTTTTTTTTIPPAVPDDATNVSVNYQGKDVYFSWEYTDGNTVAKEFHINYSYDNATWERVIITDTTARTYTLDYTNIQTGTFYWIFGVCGDLENGESCTDSDSNNFETTEYIPPTTTTVYVPPPPPPPTTIPPEEIIVDVKVEGVDKTYTQADVNDGTVDRDKERIANQDKYGCYMTDAQIERGDCDIITDDEKPDTETELPDDDVVVLEVEPIDEIKEPEPIIEEDIIEEEIKIDAEKLQEDFKFEEPEIIIEDIPEDIVIIVEDDIVEETPEVPEEVLVEPIQEDVKEEPAKVVEVPVEVIVVEEITEEQVEEVQAVVDTAIANVEELTEEQVEVVAEVLQVPTEDVEIIAEAVKTDKVVAEAVEVYVERAIENKDVENYTLADVVTEIQFEQFIENPIEVFIDIDNIDISTIGDDMTQDQKEKAQEVVVPVILTRIATMAAFIFRRN